MTLRHGYFTGAGYIYEAQAESSPERLAFLALVHGHRPPELNAEFSMIELGCGQGFHLCLQAANYPQAQFFGIDFNAEHIAHARSLAAAAGLENIRFVQADFLELDRNAGADIDWGGFDFAMAHGILSWVSPQVRISLMRLAERALRPGGLFYVSYNTLPGWLAMLPFQHCVASLQTPRGDGLPALDAGRALMSGLRQANALLFSAQPQLASRLDELSRQHSNYLLHEYNNSHWQPLYANQVIEPMRELGMSYLGSATLAENFDSILPLPVQQQIQSQADLGLRELVRDLCTNKAFRRDVYVKGIDPLWPRDVDAAIQQVSLCGLMDQIALDDETSFNFSLSWGSFHGNRDWMLALMGGLRDGPRTLADLQQHLPSETPQPLMIQNISLLLGSNAVALVPAERDPGPGQRFNAHIAARVAAGAPYSAVACPLSGNLRRLSGIEFLALNAIHQGCSEDDLTTAIDAGLRALQQPLLRNGQPVPTSARQSELEHLTHEIQCRCLPLLRRLGAL